MVFMAAMTLKNVLYIVANEVESAEYEENTHGETGEHLGALKAEGVPDTAPFPDLEVPEDLDGHADQGGTDVEEDQVREGCHSEGTMCRQEQPDGHEAVAQTPVQAMALVLGHRLPCFPERGHREITRQGEGRAHRRLLEDLVLRAYARVLVLVAATLADARLDGRGRDDLGLEVERVRGVRRWRRYLNGRRILAREVVVHAVRHAWNEEAIAVLESGSDGREALRIVEGIMSGMGVAGRSGQSRLGDVLAGLAGLTGPGPTGLAWGEVIVIGVVVAVVVFVVVVVVVAVIGFVWGFDGGNARNRIRTRNRNRGRNCASHRSHKNPL